MENTIIANDIYQVAEIELIYKTQAKVSQRPKVVSSKDAYGVFMKSWNMNKIELLEEFKVLLLNKANKVLAMYEMSTGGISGTVADVRLVFASALKANAVSIVLCHNHPSGNIKPSRQDEFLTQKFKSAGDVLDINVTDHLIISKDQYFSFKDEGYF